MIKKIGEKIFSGIKKVGQKVFNFFDRKLGEKVNNYSKEFENDHDTHISKDQLTDEDRQMIQFGKESYKASDKRDKNIGDFIYDKGNSNFETAFYKNDKTKQSKVVHRGSKSIEDWLITDPAIGLGLTRFTPRYKRVQERIKNSNLDGYDIENVGHSLGGGLAKKLAQDNNQKAYTLNGASGYVTSMVENLSRLNCNMYPEKCKNIRGLRASNDLVSSFQGGGGIKNKIVDILDGGALGSHMLEIFD